MGSTPDGEARESGVLVTPAAGRRRVLVTPAAGRRRVLVIGLGSPDRGDDGVGPAIAAAVGRALAGRGTAGVHVVEHEDPTALVDLLDPAGGIDPWDAVVIVDALRSGSAPGTVTVLDVGSDGADLAALGARLDPGPAGTHGLGLASALELARALDRLPPLVTVVGIEALGFDHGAPLSAAVVAAVPAATEVILSMVGTVLATD
ncbi:MAG: hydrogenase maturation protease [Candidatus Nanopelagicales bacterium]|nr:hydrogenase maturation protease [Candidatus Nanopelagicales bacterium]